MPTTTARVFLLSDSPDLDLLIMDFADFLKTQTIPEIEPILLEESEDPTTARPRERREGDFLLALFGGRDETATAAAVECCLQGAGRHMLLIPVFTRPDEPEEASLLAFERNYPLHRISLDVAYEILLPSLHSLLQTQYALGSPDTDLFLNGPIGTGTPSTALGLLSADAEDGDGASSQLAASAQASRQQASRTIEARLFDSAIEVLTRAASFDATSSITCHWRARLLAARNRREDLHDALNEATRSARLAHMKKPGSTAEAAGWHLAAFIAARLGDRGAAREYLEETLRFDSGDAPFALNIAALQLQIGEDNAALKHIEDASARDTPLLGHALAIPALAQLRRPLEQLRAQREQVLHDALDRLSQSDEYLLIHAPLEVSKEREDEPEQIHQPDSDQATLEVLQDALKATAIRQIEHLGIWAEDLCAQHVEMSTLRRQEAALSENALELPPRSPWDGPLEFIWPPARRLRRELETAREESLLQRKQIDGKLLEKTADFFGSLEAFLRAVGKCERAIADAPALFSGKAAAEAPKAGELAFLTAGDFARFGLKQDPTLLPDALAEYIGETLEVPNARVPGIYRIEATESAELGASRCGVFFHRMREAS